MADDTNGTVSDLREKVDQLDSNQEDLIEIMKTLREKVTEVASGDGMDTDAVQELEEHVGDVEKQLRQLKLKEGKDIAEVKNELETIEDNLQEEGGDDDGLEDVQNDLKTLHAQQDELSDALAELRDSFQELQERSETTPPAPEETVEETAEDAEAADAETDAGDEAEDEGTEAGDKESGETLPEAVIEGDVLEDMELVTAELGETIQHIEQMFRDVGTLRRETSVMLEGVSEEQHVLLERLNSIEKRMQELEIQEKVDKAEIEREIESVRDEPVDLSWVEERLEKLAIDEYTDDAELRERIREIQRTIYGSMDPAQRVKWIDTSISKRLEQVEETTKSLEDVEELTLGQEQELSRITAYLRKMKRSVENTVPSRDTDQQRVSQLSEQLEQLMEQHQNTRKHLKKLRNELEGSPADHGSAEHLEKRLEENRKRIEQINQKLDELPSSKTYKAYADRQIAQVEEELKQLSDLVLQLLDIQERKS